MDEIKKTEEKYKSFMLTEKQNQIANREGKISIAVNIILFGLKFWAGSISGSVALMADAWHTLSDSLSSLILLVGVKKSHQPPDCNHPYGHERYELVAALAIGVLLAVVGFDFMIEAITKMFSDQRAEFGLVAISVTALAIIAKELLARYSFRGARITGLKVLKAEGWHHRSDAISSVVILTGIFLKPYLPLVDELLGIAVSILLFHAAYEVIKDSAQPLIGNAPDDELVEEIKNICCHHAGINCNPHHFHIHEYGSHIELTFHVRFNGNISLKQAHECVTKIEREIADSKNIFVTIHPEPLHS